MIKSRRHREWVHEVDGTPWQFAPVAVVPGVKIRPGRHNHRRRGIPTGRSSFCDANPTAIVRYLDARNVSLVDF
jgi:hypothetical protein